MIRNVGRRFIWFLIGSTMITTFIGYALFKLASYHFQVFLNPKEH